MKHLHALVGFILFESLYAAGSSGLDHDGFQSTPGTTSIRGQRFLKSSKQSSSKSKGKSQGKKSQCKSGSGKSGSGKSGGIGKNGGSSKSGSGKIGNSKSSKSSRSKGKGKGTTCADVVPLPAPLEEDLFVGGPRDNDPSMEDEIVVDLFDSIEEEIDHLGLDEPLEEKEPAVDQDEASGSNDDTFLEDICSVLERFDTAGREFGNEPSEIKWNNYCDSVSSTSQHFLCPNSYETGKICSHENPHLDLAVQINYCEPLFRPLVDEGFKSDCVEFCINYVSIDRGDCCGFFCA